MPTAFDPSIEAEQLCSRMWTLISGTELHCDRSWLAMRTRKGAQWLHGRVAERVTATFSIPLCGDFRAWQASIAFLSSLSVPISEHIRRSCRGVGRFQRVHSECKPGFGLS